MHRVQARKVRERERNIMLLGHINGEIQIPRHTKCDGKTLRLQHQSTTRATGSPEEQWVDEFKLKRTSFPQTLFVSK